MQDRRSPYNTLQGTLETAGCRMLGESVTDYVQLRMST
jgi:hypothetical protein